MKKINEYLCSSVFESVDKGVSTNNNAGRLAALEKHLKGKNYSDYVSELNKMLDDDKVKALLIDGFGGDLGDTKLDFSETLLSVAALSPTQSEIDVTKSVNYALLYPKNIDNYFSNVVVINCPLITFKKEFIIDGHHRWSQVFAFNPKAKMKVYDYSSSEINSIQMLKCVQGAIAAVKADDNDNNGSIPSNKVNGKNVYDFDADQISEYIQAVLAGKVYAMKDKSGKELFVEDEGKLFVETLRKYVDSVTDAKSAADYIAKNFMEIKSNHSPVQGAPNRGDMPQTDKASPDGEDSKNFGPKDDGSALNKLKDGEVATDVVK